MSFAKKFVSVWILVVCLVPQTSFGATQQLKWLFAHGPLDPKVLELVTKYSKRVSDRSQNEMKVTVEQFPESTWQSSPGWVYRWNAAFNKLMNGEADIVQLATEELVSKDPLFEVFDLPFLFKNQDHLERVMTSDVAKSLLERVPAATGGKVRAFAFTYSGGFRVLATDRELTSAKSFKGLRATRENYRGSFDVMRAEMFKLFGSSLEDVIVSPGFFGPGANKVDLVQIPYKDVLVYKELTGMKPRFISDDHISVFTTVILMNEGAFQALSEKNKAILTEEINDLAKTERAAFVKINGDAKRDLPKLLGTKVRSLPAGEVAKLKKMAEPIYTKFNALPGGADLVNRVSAEAK